MIRVKNVDEYIAGAPEEIREKLRIIRELIKSVVPEAQEKISYGMPYYDYNGRLVYFAYFKTHIGLYIPPPVIEENKKELDGYKTTKSALHLPLDKKLPVKLIKKLIKARVKINKLTGN